MSSPAFAGGGSIPVRYTADGEGVSPPLAWTGVPRDAFELFALNERVRFDHPPGRRELFAAMRPYVIARGVLSGTYERPGTSPMRER